MESLINQLEPILTMRWIYTREWFFLIAWWCVLLVLAIWYYHTASSDDTSSLAPTSPIDDGPSVSTLWWWRLTYLTNHAHELKQSTSISILYTLLLQFLEIKYQYRALARLSLSALLEKDLTTHEQYLIETIYLSLYKDEPVSDQQQDRLIQQVWNLGESEPALRIDKLDWSASHDSDWTKSHTSDWQKSDTSDWFSSDSTHAW